MFDFENWTKEDTVAAVGIGVGVVGVGVGVCAVCKSKQATDECEQIIRDLRTAGLNNTEIMNICAGRGKLTYTEVIPSVD